MRRIVVALIALSCLVSQACSQRKTAEMPFEGSWMVAEMVPVDAEGKPNGQMKPKPGSFWLEVRDGVFVLHYVTPNLPELKVEEGSYTVEKEEGGRHVLSYVMTGAKRAKRATVERQISGWKLELSGGYWLLIPMDHQAIAAFETEVKQAQAFLNAPLPALSENQLHGTINGKPWLAQTSKASRLQTQEGIVLVEIFGEPLPKTPFARKESMVYLSVPKKLGRHALGNLINGTVSFECEGSRQNQIIRNGFVEVFEMTDATLTIGVVGRSEGGAVINGRMVVDITRSAEDLKMEDQMRKMQNAKQVKP
jgi:hypothetical protein